jgi:hypothetical protein
LILNVFSSSVPRNTRAIREFLLLTIAATTLVRTPGKSSTQRLPQKRSLPFVPQRIEKIFSTVISTHLHVVTARAIVIGFMQAP